MYRFIALAHTVCLDVSSAYVIDIKLHIVCFARTHYWTLFILDRTAECVCLFPINETCDSECWLLLLLLNADLPRLEQ